MEFHSRRSSDVFSAAWRSALTNARVASFFFSCPSKPVREAVSPEGGESSSGQAVQEKIQNAKTEGAGEKGNQTFSRLKLSLEQCRLLSRLGEAILY